jgi:hypothetical protein
MINGAIMSKKITILSSVPVFIFIVIVVALFVQGYVYNYFPRLYSIYKVVYFKVFSRDLLDVDGVAFKVPYPCYVRSNNEENIMTIVCLSENESNKYDFYVYIVGGKVDFESMINKISSYEKNEQVSILEIKEYVDGVGCNIDIDSIKFNINNSYSISSAVRDIGSNGNYNMKSFLIPFYSVAIESYYYSKEDELIIDEIYKSIKKQNGDRPH